MRKLRPWRWGSPPKITQGWQSWGAAPSAHSPGCCLCSSLGISPFLTPTMSISFYGDWDHLSQSEVCKSVSWSFNLNCKTALIPTSERSWSFAKIETPSMPFQSKQNGKLRTAGPLLHRWESPVRLHGAWNKWLTAGSLACSPGCMGPAWPWGYSCLCFAFHCVCVGGWTCLVLGVRWSPPSLDRIHLSFFSFFF